jgi:hypothetical protein
MSFTIASNHERTFLHGIVHFPESLQLKLNCCADDFSHSTHVCYYVAPSCDVYTRTSGTIAFVHPRVRCTATMRFDSHQVRRADDTCCVTTVFDIQWTDQVDFESWLGFLECKVRLNLIPWRHIVRGDSEYVAIRTIHVGDLTDATRRHLHAAGGKLNYNVSFTDKAGTFSHRAVAVPAPLMYTEHVGESPMWGIVTFHPYPTLRAISANMSEMFTVPCRLCDLPCESEETHRFESQVVRCLLSMNPRDEISASIEITTPRGPATYDIRCIRTRASAILIFTKR